MKTSKKDGSSVNTKKPMPKGMTSRADIGSAQHRPGRISLLWKSIAVIFLMLFCSIIILGILRWNYYRPSYHSIDSVQKELAMNLISQDMGSSGKNISEYKTLVSNMTHKFARGRVNKNTLQVSLYSPSSRHQYIIDIDSGTIVMHSETLVYGWMHNLTSQPEKRGWFFMRDYSGRQYEK
ncbi:MAG TPA: hypothetical protein VJI75_05055 [Candidatus Nanoarchaeia archaeon]|nr:hypothetical protein [Candidatus Nanoarchaeia archaeon]